MLSLYLHRHGETNWNEQGKILGQCADDAIDFTEMGLAQIDALAQRYMTSALSAIYSSDLKRARLTAEAISSRLNVPLQLSSELRALHMGKYHGRSASEFRSDPDVIPCFSDFSKKIPGGESIGEFRNRLLSFIQNTAIRHNDGECILVISHSAAISNIRSLLSGAPYADIDHCHITFDAAGPKVLETSVLEDA